MSSLLIVQVAESPRASVIELSVTVPVWLAGLFASSKLIVSTCVDSSTRVFSFSGSITYSNPYLGNTYGIAGFVALMIGGTERPVAAMVGGLVLGILEEASKSLINTQASDWFPFVVVVVILLLMPQGLFSIGPQLRGLGRRWRRPRPAVT